MFIIYTNIFLIYICYRYLKRFILNQNDINDIASLTQLKEM